MMRALSNLVLYALGATAICITAVLLYMRWNYRGAQTNAETVGGLAALNTYFFHVNTNGQTEIPKLINSNGNMDPNVIMARYILTNGFGSTVPIVVDEQSGSPKMIDGWRTPLIVMTRQQVERSNRNSRFLNATQALYVWSAGKNRVNEFGNGDDLFESR